MRALLLASSICIMAFASLASAQTTASTSAAVTAPTYEQRVREATEQIAHGDRAAGMASLRTAVADAPSRPDAHCTLAEGYRAGGDFTAALDNFQTCLRFAREADNLLYIARALHGVASSYERMPEHLTDARTAWMEYAHFADGASRVASAAEGRERVQAIDVAGEQERVYVDVRARIAERERIAREAPPPPPPSPAPTGRGRATHR
jgi:hypothetical protein